MFAYQVKLVFPQNPLLKYSYSCVSQKILPRESIQANNQINIFQIE